MTTSLAESLRINAHLSIPRRELRYRATRSGGPGGQHVNTSATRVEVLWDVQGSSAISEPQRNRILLKLSSRLDADGMVRVVASEYRSQQQNRTAAEGRLALLVRQALVVPKPRKKSKPSRRARERRLADKKRRGEQKRDRRGDFGE